MTIDPQIGEELAGNTEEPERRASAAADIEAGAKISTSIEREPGGLTRFSRPLLRIALFAVAGLFIFATGLGTGYAVWGLDVGGLARAKRPAAAVNLPASYTIPVHLGDLGPQLIGSGAIDYQKFVQLYQENGQPLTQEQVKMLTLPSDKQITIDAHNAHFLLNVFWAIGLANKNRILTDGPISQQGKDQIGSFASTGGWTLGEKSPVELFASTALIKLTAEQQALVEGAAAAVYRPCCGNATLFPDCNHGMAMLGLLELMASQGASKQQMLETAKYVNAFWFPQQTSELAAYFKANKKQDFAQVDPAEIVGAQYSSGDGARQVHEWLAQNKLLPEAPNGGGGCAA